MFRVGAYDETLRQRGVSHLVEHLALHELRDSEITFNGSVTSHTTVFTGQGHPDEVGEFLRSVCRSIHDLPFDRLSVEADVLRREEALRPFSYFDSIMWAYFGPRGPGAAGSREFGLDWLTPDEIRTWASSHFTRGNAAVLIVGKPPDSFGLDLPDGAARPYRAPERTKVAPETPTLFDTQQNGVTWGTLIKHRKGSLEPAFFAGLDIVTQRLQDRLRHDLGRTYSIPHGWHRIDVDYMAASHGFDCEAARSREAGLEHLTVIREFLETGPTQDELQRVLRMQIKAYEDHPHAAAQHHLFDEAESHLAGWGPTTSLEDYRHQMGQLTSEEVAARFHEAYRQSFTIADLPPEELAPLQSLLEFSSKPLPGVQFVSKRRHRRNQAGIVRIGPEGISALYAEGWLNTPQSRIALVAVNQASIDLFGDSISATFETAKYVGPSMLSTRTSRLALGGLLLALGAVTGVAVDGLLGLVIALVGGVLISTAPRPGTDESELADKSLTMEQAVKTYIDDERILPVSRIETGATAKT